MPGDAYVGQPDLVGAGPGIEDGDAEPACRVVVQPRFGTVPSARTSATTECFPVATRTFLTGAPLTVSNVSDTRSTVVGRSNLTSTHWPSGLESGAVSQAV